MWTCLFVISEFPLRERDGFREGCFVSSLEVRQHTGVYQAAGCLRSSTAVTMATRCAGISLQHHLGFACTISQSVWRVISPWTFPPDMALTEHLPESSCRVCILDSRMLRPGNFAQTTPPHTPTHKSNGQSKAHGSLT